MIKINIDRQPLETKQLKPAWLRLGFRPFFLGAGLYAVLAILFWAGIYILRWQPVSSVGSTMVWHAHEMIYGYGMAVIAGFLLTAVRNWTGIPTLNGYALLGLFLFWMLPRILLLPGISISLGWIAILDNLFILLLLLAVLLPVLKSGQWRQLAIMFKLLMLLAGNVVFYLGVADLLTNGVRYGLYSGLYLIMAMVFTIGRRVIPGFIERGVGYSVVLRNSKWLDISSMLLFFLFWVFDLFDPFAWTTGLLAVILSVIHAVRLTGWYTHGVWRKPLLWILFIAYAALVLGFVLKAGAVFGNLSPYLAVHAFAMGGIGMMTLGMMARVSLGHTGRNVFNPPPVLFWMFSLLLAGFICRVVLPALMLQYYVYWIVFAQIFWVLAFGMFVWIYFPILTRARLDGQDG